MTIQYLRRENKPALAFRHIPAGPASRGMPAVMFLGGYRSDMEGTKAVFLEERCVKRGQEYIRFDYSGHGASEGKFEDGTIGTWKDDALAILDHIAPGSVILVGSSMGGWISFLVARERPAIVRGIAGIAAAPDFTEELFNHRLTEEQRARIMEKGEIRIPNDYSDEPYVFTRALFEDGKKQCFLKQGIELSIPVRLVQGMKDADVEWQTAHRIRTAVRSPDIEVVLIENGDHRLSKPEELGIIWRQVLYVSG